MSETAQHLDRATALLRRLWGERGGEPAAAGLDWLQGPWGEVLAEAEQISRAGADRVPLRVLFDAARALAQGGDQHRAVAA